MPAMVKGSLVLSTVGCKGVEPVTSTTWSDIWKEAHAPSAILLSRALRNVKSWLYKMLPILSEMHSMMAAHLAIAFPGDQANQGMSWSMDALHAGDDRTLRTLSAVTPETRMSDWIVGPAM